MFGGQKASVQHAADTRAVLCLQQDGKVKFYLKDCSNFAVGRAVSWTLSSHPDEVSEDAIFIKQSAFATAAKFKSCRGNHFTTMHQTPGSDSIITWRSKTFR